MTRPSMSRAAFLGRLAAFGCATLGTRATLSARTAAARNPSPNFIVVLSDDHTYRAIGYNNPLVKTPNLDRLGREGVIFENAYVATPICAASRASLLTGLFPQEHGAIALDGGGFHDNVVTQRRMPTLPQLLSAAGYHTAFCGKSHLGPPRDYGFAAGDESTDPTDDSTFAFARDYLAARNGDPRPFFLWVAARQPHLPLRPPQEWLDLYREATIPPDPNFRPAPPAESVYNQGLPGEHYYRDSEATKNHKGLPAGPPRSEEQIWEFTRAYYAVVSRLDDQIGRLVDQLKASGQYENTVLIYLSDNGYFLGNHGLGNKITMHEESVRVPMLLHWPGLPRKGISTHSLVSSLDLFPTVLGLAGMRRPRNLSGKSLLPLLRRPERALRPYVASECVGVGGKKGMGHRMVRTTRWKYVLTDVNEEVLYDEQNDPFEQTNAIGAGENRTVLVALRGYMRDWMTRVGDTHRLPPRS